MRILEELKQEVEELWDSATEGWRRPRHPAAGALTRFGPDAKSPALDVRNRVLKVELTKAEPTSTREVQIKVS